MEGSAEKYLEHHGILGMKWGVRRYQNKDGTLTKAGRKRYLNDDGSYNDTAKKEIPLTALSTKELQDRTNRLNAQNNYIEAKRRYENNTKKEPSKAAKLVAEFLQSNLPKLGDKLTQSLTNAIAGKDDGSEGIEAYLAGIDFTKEFDSNSLKGLDSKQIKQISEYVKNVNSINSSMTSIYSKYEKRAEQQKQQQQVKQEKTKKEEKKAKKEQKKTKKEEKAKKKQQRQADWENEEY